MNTVRRFGLLFLVFVVLLLVTFPALAQDAVPTEEPPVVEPTVVEAPVTEEAPVVEPTVEPVPDEPAPPVVDENPATGEIRLSLSTLLLFMGVAAIGGGGLLAVIYRFMERRETQDAAEKLYLSASPEQQRFIKDMMVGYSELSNRLLDFMTKITDGQPNDTDPALRMASKSLYPTDDGLG